MSAAIMALIPFLRGFRFVFNQTISADTSNYNLRAAAVAAGWDQSAPLVATVTISSGIVVSANNTANYAFDTGVTFPAGSVLELANNGYVIGMGGAGGPGPGQNGRPGGAALRAQFALKVTNSGTIGGGGGGGYSSIAIEGGGGGRSGRTNSAGGVGGDPTYTGRAGTFTSGGAAGLGGAAGGTTGPGTDAGHANFGGGGGGWGARGGNTYGFATGGGAGGAAVVGNSNITWVATGTRYGAIT